MNYRHAFHAGNHADVLKHVVLLALCDALAAKPAPCFALDTHAGRGLYALDADAAQRTGEARSGVARLAATAAVNATALPTAIRRYLDAVAACRAVHGETAYPGSPWLLAHALRAQDRITCCELEPGEAAALRVNLGRDQRVVVQLRDGYDAIRAQLPPRHGEVKLARGLVLVDPPYEAQLEEFDTALSAIREGLQRWPQGMFVLWYPVKLRRSLGQFLRSAAALPAKSAWIAELLVRPADSPLRLNGSGMLVLNAPWKLDEVIGAALPVLRRHLGEAGASYRLDWLRRPA